MSQINIRNLSNENDDGSPEIVGVSTFSATSFFVPPKGTTAERPSDCEPGSIRFNTDTANLEYFRGKTIGWSQFELVTPNLGGGTGSNTGLGTRILIMGGNANPANLNIIEFITVETKGNSQDFGDLSQSFPFASDGACGSRVRALTTGGVNDAIDFVTISSQGNGTDFGDYHGDMQAGAVSNNIRGIFAGGYVSQPLLTVSIDYVTIAQTANAVDFGSLEAPNRGMASFSSTTRGVFAGGTAPAPAYTKKNEIQFVTIMTTGNTTDFGDIGTAKDFAAGASNATRGLIAGGRSPSATNVIQYVTIATTGNAQDFGDLIEATEEFSASSSSREAVFVGGNDSPNIKNTIVFASFATTGNAQDFGDLTAARYHASSTSSGHGGL